MEEKKEKKLTIQIYRNKSADELTSLIADPGERPDAGSAAAASGALAAALLCRAVRLEETEGLDPEKQDWYVRNSEILRTYLLKLIDEDVKCRGPLRRALKEGDEHALEAARQVSVSICLEIVNMMGKCLEMAVDYAGCLKPGADARFYLMQCADLAYGASLAAGGFIRMTAAKSTDETWRYVMNRENELTVQPQTALLERLRSCCAQNT